MVLRQSRVRAGDVHRLIIAVALYCCMRGALLCMLGSGVSTCPAICVNRLSCHDVYRAQTKSAHLLRDVEARPEPRCMAVSGPTTISCVSVSELVSLLRPCLPRMDVVGGGVAAERSVEVVAAGGWVGVLAAGWVI